MPESNGLQAIVFINCIIDKRRGLLDGKLGIIVASGKQALAFIYTSILLLVWSRTALFGIFGK